MSTPEKDGIYKEGPYTIIIMTETAPNYEIKTSVLLETEDKLRAIAIAKYVGEKAVDMKNNNRPLPKVNTVVGVFSREKLIYSNT